jgi:hypothetical protein
VAADGRSGEDAEEERAPQGCRHHAHAKFPHSPLHGP